jgi:hypothetical protein
MRAFLATNLPGRCPNVVSPKRLARPGPSAARDGLTRRAAVIPVRVVSLCQDGAIILRGSDKPARGERSIRSAGPSGGTSLERIAPESLTRNRRRSFTARCRAAMMPRHQIQYADDPDEPLAGLQSTIVSNPPTSARVKGDIRNSYRARAARRIAAPPSLTDPAWWASAAAAVSH